MMSGHGGNPIFFNKKNKDWAPRTLANHPLPTCNSISFLPYPPPPPPPHPTPTSLNYGRHMCITPYVV